MSILALNDIGAKATYEEIQVLREFWFANMWSVLITVTAHPFFNDDLGFSVKEGLHPPVAALADLMWSIRDDDTSEAGHCLS
ncbi:hypothetical protein [Rhizobium sp. A37_96]